MFYKVFWLTLSQWHIVAGALQFAHTHQYAQNLLPSSMLDTDSVLVFCLQICVVDSLRWLVEYSACDFQNTFVWQD